MTTIVCDPDRGEMAGDTQISTSTTTARSPKVMRLRDGGLFGYAGYAWMGRALFNWLNGGMEGRRPTIAGLDALILDSEGILWSVDAGRWPPIILNGPSAIGTGEQAAMAAMRYFGATAKQAVEAAGTVDPNTSKPVTVMRLRKPRNRRKL